MGEAFDIIMEGLDDARRFRAGERDGSVVHEVLVAAPDEHGDDGTGSSDDDC